MVYGGVDERKERKNERRKEIGLEWLKGREREIL
jgi:hypothetical protein